jgi:hypothetical protein
MTSIEERAETTHDGQHDSAERPLDDGDESKTSRDGR